MAYKRKTRDEIEVQGDYGADFECLTTCETRKEARDDLRSYRENWPGYSYRIKTVRVPIDPA